MEYQYVIGLMVFVFLFGAIPTLILARRGWSPVKTAFLVSIGIGLVSGLVVFLTSRPALEYVVATPIGTLVFGFIPLWLLAYLSKPSNPSPNTAKPIVTPSHADEGTGQADQGPKNREALRDSHQIFPHPEQKTSNWDAVLKSKRGEIMQLQQELSRLEKEIREAREKSEKLVLETESKKRSEAKGSASIKQRIQVIINEARARGEQIDLSGIDLQGVNLQRANLAKAILIEANLESANLFKANLTQAFLENAYLLSADLAGASLVTANLTGANLDGAKGVIKP